MITILHRGEGGGVSRDPKKWLRNKSSWVVIATKKLIENWKEYDIWKKYPKPFNLRKPLSVWPVLSNFAVKISLNLSRAPILRRLFARFAKSTGEHHANCWLPGCRSKYSQTVPNTSLGFKTVTNLSKYERIDSLKPPSDVMSYVTGNRPSPPRNFSLSQIFSFSIKSM